MTKLKQIDYKGGGKRVKAFQCYPERKTSLPGVVILHGAEGYKSHHTEFSKSLAEKEYAVLTPLWFEKDTEEKTAQDVESNDIPSGIEYLKSLDYVAADRIGMIGFSLGALLALVISHLLLKN